MKMCCNVYYIPFAFNAIISFVFSLTAGSAYSLPQINAEAVDFDSTFGSSSLSNHVEKRDDPSVVSPAWFGPRLGRKKRSTASSESGHDTYSRLLAGSWPGVVALYLGDEISAVGEDRWPGSHRYRQKRSVTFDEDASDASSERSNFEYYVLQLLKHYPRVLDMFRSENLGGDDQLAKSRYGRGSTWPDEERLILKTPPFSPRLGRRSSLPLKPRLGRTANTAEASVVFKPRLGRDPGTNDFSEYVEVQNGVDDKDH